MEYINNFDFKILDFIYENLHTDFLDLIVPWITSLGSHGRIWIALALILTAIPKTRKAGITALTALLIGYIVTNVTLKNLFGRIRPFDINTSIELLINPPHDPSFPSGHTCSSFAAATGIFCFDKRLGMAALVLAAIIGMTRLYLYVHYPTDVLAGAIIGVVVGVLSAKIINNKAIENRLFGRIDSK